MCLPFLGGRVERCGGKRGEAVCVGEGGKRLDFTRLDLRPWLHPFPVMVETKKTEILVLGLILYGTSGIRGNGGKP